MLLDPERGPPPDAFAGGTRGRCVMSHLARHFYRLALIASVGLTGACLGDPNDPRHDAFDGGAPRTALARSAAAEAQVEVGTSLEAVGRVTAGVHEVHAGEPLYVSVAVGGTSGIDSGARLQALWRGPSARLLAQDSRVVPSGESFVSFVAPLTTGWTAGVYRVEIYCAGARAGSAEFVVSAASGA